MKVTTDSCLFGAWTAQQLRHLKSNHTILDIGSGSGLLSMMMAQQTAARIEGIEIQASDYEQSLENISQSPFAGQIRIYHADVLNFPFQQPYDIIVSNPPFYEKDLKGSSSGKNIAHHDTGLQLDSLLKLVQKNLSSSAILYLLLPAKRWEDVQQLISEQGLHVQELVWVCHSEKHAASRIMVKASLKTSAVAERNLYIYEDNAYSLEFQALLSDYYL